MIFFSVLYGPDSNAIDNINLASKFGFRPVVFLNMVDSDYLKMLVDLDAVILGNNENVGLGAAFYQLERYLLDIGEDYYVYFDQDTVTTQETWSFILNSYSELFSMRRTGLVFFGRNEVPTSDLVVSSGCMFSMRVIHEIGGHNRSFFVEGVDYEFCLRLKINGFLIRNAFTDSVDHCALQEGTSFKFWGFNVPVRVYGVSRTRDFNMSHIKLLNVSLMNCEYLMFFKFLKSAFLFNVREFFSRLAVRFL